MIKPRVTGQNIFALLLLFCLLPFNLLFTVFAVLVALGRHKHDRSKGKTVMISGGKMTKSLHLARSFSRAGYRVILLETHKYWLAGSRFSWHIDRFYTVPNYSEPDYAHVLLDIVKSEKVDVYIPVCSPVAAYFDSKAIEILAKHCQVFQASLEITELLDDKYRFIQTAQALGLTVPKSFLITAPQQVIDFDFSQEKHPYILKSIKYDAVRRLNLTKLPCENMQEFVNSLPISPDNPWIMQEFIAGQEYCTHSTVKNGELRVHCCCQSSPFQVNYKYIEHPQIKAWVETFVEKMQITGQISFDFIQSAEDGKVYPIECNPRTHSAITMFYNHPELAEAYLSDNFDKTIVPLPDSLPTYWLYHELWRLVTHLFDSKEVLKRLKIIFGGKEALFSWDDPLPFLMVYHWQIPLLLLQDLVKQKGWIRIDFNIGKLVQLEGD